MSPARRAHPLGARIRYRIDDLFSHGTSWMIAWLVVATLGLILFTATIATIAGIRPEGERVGFIEAIWLNLLRTLDPGTMGGDAGWPFRIVSLIATLGGIFIVSSLIGLLATGINTKLEDLRRGKSPVLETGHTLILGWSPKIFTILAELVIANENRRSASVVVLADRDKSEMDEQLRGRVPQRGTMRVVVRTGVPFEPLDLSISNPQDAKSIIILSPEQTDGDAQVIKTSLALIGRDIPTTVPIIAEVAERGNAAALRAASRGRVVVIQPSEIIARITAQVSRQPGLSVVYQELLDFEGDEIYFHSEPRLAGMTFGDALNSFERSTLLGIRAPDGRVTLSPPMETELGPDVQVIAIAEDDDKIVFAGPREAGSMTAPKPRDATSRAPERILVIGWNALGPQVVKELDHYAPRGSSLTIVIERSLVDDGALEMAPDLTNLSIDIKESRRREDDDYARLLAQGGYESVIILCYRRGLTEAQADARALMTLLQIVHAADQLEQPVNVITELLDVRDVRLAPQTTADQFIVSERLSSLLIVQLSENADLLEVFIDLFDEEGAEVYVKPVSYYVDRDVELTYAHLVEAGRRRGEVVLGYRVAALAESEEASFGVMINPPKSSAVRLNRDDCVIVLSEEEG